MVELISKEWDKFFEWLEQAQWWYWIVVALLWWFILLWAGM